MREIQKGVDLLESRELTEEQLANARKMLNEIETNRQKRLADS